MQLGRHENSVLDSGIGLPTVWTESLIKLLNETYAEQCEKDERFFEVYALNFDQEILVVASYIHQADPSVSPIAVFISHDQESDSKKIKKTLENITQLIGHIFDDIFAVEDWSEFVPLWTENDYDGDLLHYKITRENLSLSIQAEEILKKGSLI
jgi:hypothetical protein